MLTECSDRKSGEKRIVIVIHSMINENVTDRSGAPMKLAASRTKFVLGRDGAPSRSQRSTTVESRSQTMAQRALVAVRWAYIYR